MEMLLSVRPPTESVPTWVGCRRISGGSRVVYFGSQRVARAVVSWFATVSGEDDRAEDAMFSRKADVRLVGVEEAVVKVETGSASEVEGE